jgi:hypothetical protein
MIENSSQTANDAALFGDDYSAFERMRQAPAPATNSSDDDNNGDDDAALTAPAAGEPASKTKPPASEPEKPSADDDNDEAKQPKGLQKRFRELTGKIADLEAKLAAATAGKPVEEKGSASPTGGNAKDAEPKPEGFATYDEYVRALSQWTAKAAYKAEAEQAKAQTEAKTERDTWETRKAEAAKTAGYEDIEEVLEAADIPITPVMQRALLRSEVGPKLAHYLAKNEEEAARIAKLDPLDAALAMGAIEATIRAASSSKVAVEIKKVSKAPKPPTPVAGGSRKTGVELMTDPETSFEDFERTRNAQLRRRAGR